MIASDVVLLASGTAALEAMLCKRPMVIGHRISGLTYAIVKAFGLLKSAHVSLPNVLAGETLVPELLQDDCTPANLHAALLRWFRDADAVAALQPQVPRDPRNPAAKCLGPRRRCGRRTAGDTRMTQRIAGIDEAGRGPLAGPVVVAAVVFPPGRTPVNGLDDSKALTARKRELLYPRIIERALAWKIVFIEPAEIDRRNIFQATLHGMREALLGVAHVADLARIDGNRLPPDLPCPAEALDRWRCTRPQHHGRVDPGQGRARPGDARVACALPAIRLRPAQGLPQPDAPASPARARSVPAASAQFRPGARLRWRSVARGFAGPARTVLSSRAPACLSSLAGVPGPAYAGR